MYIQVVNDRVAALNYADEGTVEDDIWQWVDYDFGDNFNDYLYINGQIIFDPLPEPLVPASPQEVLGSLIEAQSDSLLPLIPDDILVRMFNYFPEWDGNGIEYTVGQIVTYEEIIYKVIQAHISQITWTPKDSPSLFAKVLTDPDNPQPWQQPDSTNPYMKGDRVTHNGSIWESTIDNNVWEPGVYGWVEVE